MNKDKNINIRIPIKDIQLSSVDNDVFMTLTMPVATTRTNLNGLRFTSEFFEKRKDTLVDMPLLVSREKLESGETQNLTHEFDGQDFNTDAIGTIFSSWIEDYDESGEIKVLMASAKVWKRFGETCDAIIELYNDDELEFSMELLATDIVEYADRREIEDGSFIGHTIVSNGAERACATNQLLVAEAYVKDIENKVINEGGNDLPKDKKVLKGGLSSDLIYSKLNQELDSGVWVSQLFQDDMKFVAYDYTNQTHKIMSYTIDGETVTIDKDSAVEGSLIWKTSDEITQEDLKIAEIASLKVEKDELQKKVDELESASIETNVEADIDIDIDDKTVEYAEQIIKLNEKIESMSDEIEGFKKYKEKYEQAEAEKQEQELATLKESLKEMAQRVVGKENDVTEEMAEAIENVNEKELKLAIAEYYLSNNTEEDADDDGEVINAEVEVDYSNEKIELY